MPVMKKQCATCPFRGASEQQVARDAIIDPSQWGCHSDAAYGWTEKQCRGHWRARRKYPPTDAEIATFENWQSDFNKKFALGVDIDDLPPSPVREIEKTLSPKETE